MKAHPPPRAVLFDLDGTLVDSLEDIGAAMNRALGRHGLPQHSLEAYRHFVGEGVVHLTARAVPEDHPELRASVLEDYQRDYAANSLVETALYPGVAELLDGLAARGLPLAILSNKPQEPAETLARTLLGKWRFAAVFGERPGVPRKPDPAAALEIAAALAVSPPECLFVGDTAIDMKTAAAAGMAAVGVLWGFRGREELIAAGAQHLLDSPLNLLGLFE